MVKRPGRSNEAKAGHRAETVNNDEEFVRALYTGMLNRDADPGGLATYVSKLANGSMSKPDLVRVFVLSDEFKQKYGASEGEAR